MTCRILSTQLLYLAALLLPSSPVQAVTLAITGDSGIARSLSIDNTSTFRDMISVLRSADVAITNLEGLVSGEAGAPAGGPGVYIQMTADPFVVEELQWAGFDMVSRANNHAMDYGGEGLLASSRILDQAGLVHAGVGAHLAQARAPAYLDTPHGRVALISCASTFPPHAVAGAQRADSMGRAGLSPLRFQTRYRVAAEAFTTLQYLAEVLAIPGSIKLPRKDDGTLDFLGRTFVIAEKPGVETRPHPGDLAQISASVKDARRLADWVIVSLHAHETALDDPNQPAEFIRTAAHRLIDAGADFFVVHGAHRLQGIELYAGKPIFYGLGNFIMQAEAVRVQSSDIYEVYGLPVDSTPADLYESLAWFSSDPSYNEAAIAIVDMDEQRRVRRVELHPVVLTDGPALSQRGTPQPAGVERGEAIIRHIAAISEPFATKIRYRDGLGIITGPASRTQPDSLRLRRE